MSGLDHTDRLLSANRTQESFLYSTATPNSSNGDILGASRTGPVNRFEHLLNSASRRSQIEQVVADDMDEDYIESTQVDMCCLDATQVDSPVVRNLSVTEVLVLNIYIRLYFELFVHSLIKIVLFCMLD